MVNEAYRVWHGLPHMDDALQAPLNFQHFDNYRMGASTETTFKPLERIPGLAVGGWFDAGDFDIQAAPTPARSRAFVDTWEAFKPQRDQTFIDQANRFVDIHRPDGKPDLLQQIEHGALQMAAQYRAFGRAGPRDGRLAPPPVPSSRRRVDADRQPALRPLAEAVPGGGQPQRHARRPLGLHRTACRRTTTRASASLAAASRALRGFNDTLADECLALAKKAYAEERQVAAADAAERASRPRVRRRAPR